MPKSTEEPNYQAMRQELESILDILQREDLDVDEALKHYERGLELTRQLEKYLVSAENRISKLKAKFSE